MKPLAIGLAAPWGSGKTALCRELATYLGWPRVSFGDYVRSVAQARGLPVSRKVLQDLGASLIAGGWENFVHAVLRQATRAEHEGLVIDGIRHHMAITTLRTAVAPLRLCVAYLDLSEGARTERLQEKGVAGPDQVARVDSHSTEAEVRELRRVADVTVICEGPIREVRDSVLRQIEQLITATGA